MHCVECRKATDTFNVEFAVSKNGRNMKRGKCVICGTTKTQFFKAQKRRIIVKQSYKKFTFRDASSQS